VGTYSSIFIATPVVIDLRKRETPAGEKKKVKSKGAPVPAHA